METHRIAVISDTHGLLRPECLDVLEGCEAILHAGDVGKPEVLSSLRQIARVYAVRGNVDGDWAEELPRELEAEICGFKIYMVHNRKQARAGLGDVDIAVYGHSHKYEEKREGQILHLNPGSCGPKRFRLPVTMAVLTLYPEGRCVEKESFRERPWRQVHLYPEGRCVEVERVDCLPESTGSAGSSPFPGKSMDRLIRRVIREMEAGKGVPEIAARVHGEEALVEQICRIYATHPGVDVDGILNRMEIWDR